MNFRERFLLDDLKNDKISPKEALEKFMDNGPKHISQFELGDPVNALPCGFPSIEGPMFLRAAQGDLVVLAARPGQGKSALGAQIALNVAKEGAVIFYSFEMDPSVVHKRLLALESNRPVQTIHSPLFKEEVWAAQERLNKARLFLEYTPGMNIEALINNAKAFNEKNRLKLIVVDYLQIIGGHPSQIKADKIETAVTKLKQFAEEIKTPILAISQMNRAIDTRENDEANAEPVLSDLADSSSIEKWADVVMFLKKSETNFAKVYVLKNRHGESKRFSLKFSGAIAKFFDNGEIVHEAKTGSEI